MEQDLRNKIDAARADYQSGLKTDPVDIHQAKAKKVTDLMKQLNEVLNDGAKPCAKCGKVPMTILRTPGTDRMIAQYETGIGDCLERIEEGIVCAARASSAKESVANWNKGERKSRPVQAATVTEG